MAKKIDTKIATQQYKQKLRTMIGSIAHTQNIADQAMDLAKRVMCESDLNESDAYRVIENVSCVCEEALQVLIEELNQRTSIK